MRHSSVSHSGAVHSVAALERSFGTSYGPSPFGGDVVLAALPAAKPEPVIELSTLQTIALLRMRCSTLCRGIATHLQNETQDRPSMFDYRALVAHKLCYKPDDHRWHLITSAGCRMADKTARAKAKELGIHIMLPGGFVGVQQNFSCTCGKWNVCYRRGVHTDSNALHGWSRHVASAAA